MRKLCIALHEILYLLYHLNVEIIPQPLWLKHLKQGYIKRCQLSQKLTSYYLVVTHILCVTPETILQKNQAPF